MSSDIWCLSITMSNVDRVGERVDSTRYSSLKHIIAVCNSASRPYIILPISDNTCKGPGLAQAGMSSACPQAESTPGFSGSRWHQRGSAVLARTLTSKTHESRERPRHSGSLGAGWVLSRHGLSA